jgi:retron-type reverse transcriptase
MDIGKFLINLYYNDTNYGASKKIEKMYSTYYIPKRRLGNRIINSPNQELKEIQRWVYSHILEQVALPDCIHGFRKKHGIKTNANHHLGKKYVSCLDIKDFFPSITKEQVYKMFQEIDVNYDLLELVSEIDNYKDCLPFTELTKYRYIEMLSAICTFKDSLPQGAPTSPVISNIIFSKIDREIIKICNDSNITYTRYADDITFSGNNKRELLKSVNHIKSIINASDFKINPKKTRMMNGQRATIVTGLRLNANTLSIGNKRKKLLRAKIFNWIMQDDIREKEHIQGELAYLKSVEEDTYVHFIRYIEKLKKRKGEMPNLHDDEYDTAQGYIRKYYAVMNKYYHCPIKMQKNLDNRIDGLINTLLHENYLIRKLFVDKIGNFLETKKRIIYVDRKN